MNLADAGTLQQLAARYHVHVTKRFAQHFLVDEAVLGAVVAAAGIGPYDRVLEVGPGFGTLTEALLTAGAAVTAVEVDPRLARALRDRFSGNDRLRIENDEFFHWYKKNILGFGAESFAIVANLPYNISGHFFRVVLSEAERLPSRIVVTVQKEVAERVAAEPGSMSMLGLSVTAFGKPRIVRTVGKGAFWPRPEVQSAILAIDDIERPAIDPAPAFRLAAFAFSERRKQLTGVLARKTAIAKERVIEACIEAGILPEARPQELSLDDWQRLAATLTEGQR